MLLSPRLKFFVWNHFGVQTCVIFNPAARGNKARCFRRYLGKMAQPQDGQILAVDIGCK